LVFLSLFENPNSSNVRQQAASFDELRKMGMIRIITSVHPEHVEGELVKG
jgi:hypothetical protein